ncbi:MAG: LLM class flavin-dependent oxidoreductase [Chloroflexi bacterium]|nr:LLM class flavin-dependent oxidoreductase [Chloroflexota bacterium]MCI0867472.1 LLM class flavin-dependent oxidoreductase [Chloroflexota bacterium]
MTTPRVTFGCSFGVEGYWDVAEFARRAEALGYDRVTTGEHLMDGNPPRPTLLGIPVMAAAAGATKSLQVMTGIVIAPLYHPVLLAKLVTSLDVVSGGRLDFGIGISGQRGTQVEFDAVGVSVRTRGRRTNEMLEVMKRLWTEDHVSHHGDFFDLEDVTLLPRPVHQPHPPIWVSGRSDAAMRRAALLGDGWYPYLFTVRRLRQSNETIKEIAAEAGRDLAGFHWGLNQPTSISENREEAMALAVANVGQRYVTPQRSAEDIAQALCVTGTPEDCVQAIQERIDAGVRDINLGFLAEDSAGLFAQMEMFSRQVIPHFR